MTKSKSKDKVGITDFETASLITHWEKYLWDETAKIFGEELVSKLAASKLFRGKQFLLVRLLTAVRQTDTDKRLAALEGRVQELGQMNAALFSENRRLAGNLLSFIKILDKHGDYTYDEDELLGMMTNFAACMSVAAFLRQTGAALAKKEEEPAVKEGEKAAAAMAEDAEAGKILEMKPHDTHGREHPKGSKIYNG